MYLEYAHLGEPSERLRCGERDVGLGLAGFFVDDLDGIDPRRERAGDGAGRRLGVGALFDGGPGIGWTQHRKPVAREGAEGFLPGHD